MPLPPTLGSPGTSGTITVSGVTLTATGVQITGSQSTAANQDAVTNDLKVIVDQLPALVAGAATIGNVGLVAGAANIGAVAIQAGQTVGLVAGVASIGTVGLNAGTAIIGKITGDTATGTAVPANAQLIGGTDGANLRAFSVDASGRQVVIGPAAAGAAAAGNPLLNGGSDSGAIVRTMRVDGSGRQVAGSGDKATYFLQATVAGLASSGAVLTLQGSGTKIIKVRKVIQTIFSQDTTADAITLTVNKFSSLSGGTAGTAPTIGKMNSGDAAATATVNKWTAAPTIVGSVPICATQATLAIGNTTTQYGQPQIIPFGDSPAEEIVLNNANEGINFALSSSGTIGSSEAVIAVIFTEE